MEASHLFLFAGEMDDALENAEGFVIFVRTPL